MDRYQVEGIRRAFWKPARLKLLVHRLRGIRIGEVDPHVNAGVGHFGC